MIWKSSWSHKPITPVAGYSLIGFFGPVVSLTISLGAGNVAGETKKSFMAAAVFVAYCVGNIIGPQLVKSQTKAQHYPELWTGLIIWYFYLLLHRTKSLLMYSSSYCITIVSASTLYIVLRRENKKREAFQGDERERDRLAFKDLTDKQNPYFRYVL